MALVALVALVPVAPVALKDVVLVDLVDPVDADLASVGPKVLVMAPAPAPAPVVPAVPVVPVSVLPAALVALALVALALVALVLDSVVLDSVVLDSVVLVVLGGRSLRNKWSTKRWSSIVTKTANLIAVNCWSLPKQCIVLTDLAALSWDASGLREGSKGRVSRADRVGRSNGDLSNGEVVFQRELRESPAWFW